MEKDWRYRLQHVGDMFVDAFGTTILAARRSAAKVAIGLQIRDLNKKKGQVACGIGNRVIDMRRNDPNLLSYDEIIAGYYEDLDYLELKIEDSLRTRDQARQRWRRLFSCCSSSCTPDFEFDNGEEEQFSVSG